MKAVFGLLGLLAILGIAYGLAFFGVIPTQKMADKSPALAQALKALHLAKPKKAVAAAPPPAGGVSPAQSALNAQRKQLAADRVQLDKDRADFEAQKQAAPAPAALTQSAPQDGSAKLDAIYAAMSPDDLARLFARQPDPDVVRALADLDEKKAGKVLAALPDARAARLAHRMAHTTLASASSASPTPRTSL